MTDYRVHLTAKAAEHRIVEPRLLNELELPLNVAVEADEKQTTLDVIVNARVGGSFPVGASAPQNAVTICRGQGRFRVGAQRVARVGAANVRADWTGEAVYVLLVIAEVIFLLERGIICIRRQD